MCGRDDALLGIRERVLETIGCETSLVYTIEQARSHMAEKPRLILICHTAGDEMATQLRSVALQAGIPTYYIEKLLPPQQLLLDVRALLNQNTGQARPAAGKRTI